MQWNKHYNIAEGSHAFLGASNYSWLNYDADKLAMVYKNRLATLRGTELHDFACRAIRLGQKLPKSKKTICMYVNDAIGFKMQPEQLLYYSPNCFGTADAIAFKNGFLRIHDLKTGEVPAHMEQLMIYAALFCLEYDKEPNTLSGIELRIYQLDDVIIFIPEPERIKEIMQKIVIFDNRITQLKLENRL
jgi:hypothetical protein